MHLKLILISSINFLFLPNIFAQVVVILQICDIMYLRKPNYRGMNMVKKDILEKAQLTAHKYMLSNYNSIEDYDEDIDMLEDFDLGRTGIDFNKNDVVRKSLIPRNSHILVACLCKVSASVNNALKEKVTELIKFLDGYEKDSIIAIPFCHFNAVVYPKADDDYYLCNLNRIYTNNLGIIDLENPIASFQGTFCETAYFIMQYDPESVIEGDSYVLVFVDTKFMFSKDIFNIESCDKIIENLREIENKLRGARYKKGESCEELEEIRKARRKIEDERDSLSLMFGRYR